MSDLVPSLRDRLVRIQELELSLLECRASARPGSSDPLERAIRDTLDALPEEIARSYERLRNRDALAVVPVDGKSCTGCGLELPDLFLNRLHGTDSISPCPNCRRFVYHRSTSVRRLAPEPGRAAGLERLSGAGLMIPALEAETAEQAIRELASRLAGAGIVDDGARLAHLVAEREALTSTAVEGGVAFPHTRNVGGANLAFAVGMSPRGLDFRAPDREVTTIVILSVVPPPSQRPYLRMLAAWIESLRDPERRSTLEACETPKEMWKVVCRFLLAAMPDWKPAGKPASRKRRQPA